MQKRKLHQIHQTMKKIEKSGLKRIEISQPPKEILILKTLLNQKILL